MPDPGNVSLFACFYFPQRDKDSPSSHRHVRTVSLFPGAPHEAFAHEVAMFIYNNTFITFLCCNPEVKFTAIKSIATKGI